MGQVERVIARAGCPTTGPVVKRWHSDPSARARTANPRRLVALGTNASRDGTHGGGTRC